MSSFTRRQFFIAAGVGGLAVGGWAGRALLRSGRGSSAAGLREATRTGQAIGTRITITALHADRSIAEAAIDDAFAELATVEQVMSLYRPDSELSRLNRDGGLAHPHPYLAGVLGRAAAMSRASGGAFDVTVGPLWTTYARARDLGRLPTADEINAARELVDYRRVELSAGGVRLSRPGTAVTLNGIAQGFATDRLLAALRARGIGHALVNAGEVGALGPKAGGEPWVAGIPHPRRTDENVAVAPLDTRCMATSGDYATRFSDDYASHHIFDPASGRSPAELAAVTVVAPDGTTADALSTAVLVLGPKRGLALVRRTPGADALFVLKSGFVTRTEGFPTVEG